MYVHVDTDSLEVKLRLAQLHAVSRTTPHVCHDRKLQLSSIADLHPLRVPLPAPQPRAAGTTHAVAVADRRVCRTTTAEEADRMGGMAGPQLACSLMGASQVTRYERMQVGSAMAGQCFEELFEFCAL